MKLRHTIGFAALVSLMLASCYPVKEKPNASRDPKQIDKTAPVLTPEQQKAKEAEELKKKEEALKKEEELKKEKELISGQTPEPGTSNPTGPGKKEETKKTADYQFGSKVPGKEGFVLSPYNNKLVDVRGFPSGQLVQDPTFPASEKKYFRVP